MKIGKITEWGRKKESCLKVEKEFSVVLVLHDKNTPIGSLERTHIQTKHWS